MKMWAGRFTKELDKSVNDFNSSIRFDCRMFESDIMGSIAHATMLGNKGIITKDESNKIIDGLLDILNDIKSGVILFDSEAEDIHMFIEALLTNKIGDVGKKLHTARSRNDQVALDIKMYLKTEVTDILSLVKELVETLSDMASCNKETIMPGYTHLQRAQPITFANHLLAYCQMFLRDISRFNDCYKRMNIMPLGSCALAGTTYDIDRLEVCKTLGFSDITSNSLDGVSDRDFCVELASAISICMMHLSRFSEEIIMWSSWEFKFIDLDDAYSTGSSIMPQKKNPDIAELVRGKTGRVYGDLITLLTMLKALPLAYNKDMQEDKEAIFDSVDTVKQCLSVFIPMLKTLKVNKENMRNAASKGFINATDLADYLVKKGLPFRDAYKVSGNLVLYCVLNNKVLEDLTLEEFNSYSNLIEDDCYEAINLENATFRRTSDGASSIESVTKQIEKIKEILK